MFVSATLTYTRFEYTHGCVLVARECFEAPSIKPKENLRAKSSRASNDGGVESRRGIDRVPLSFSHAVNSCTYLFRSSELWLTSKPEDSYTVERMM